MPLSTTSFPFTLLFGVAFVIIVALGGFILLLRGYYRAFPQDRSIKILAVPVIVTIVGLSAIFLNFHRTTRLVEVKDVQCGDSRIFPGKTTVLDISSQKEIALNLPISGLEGGRMRYFDSQGSIVDYWYNSYFCQKGDIFKKEIQEKRLNVVTNGFGRIVEWHEYK